MKRFCTLLLLLVGIIFGRSTVYAQISVASTTVDAAFIQTLFGPGVQLVSGPTVNCPNVAIGKFSNGASIGFTGSGSGLLMTTGNINNALGPNSVGNKTTCNSSAQTPLSDTDLGAITTGTTRDRCVLTFQVQFSSSYVQFNNYIFGSEEYPEYVNSNFNDVFAIFVDGPNPNGPAYNKYNAARVLPPGPTGIPVTINNINSSPCCTPNVPAGTNCSCPQRLYVGNNAGANTEYDGYTQPLFSSLNVVPGSTYTIKIGIADVGDCSWDSGLFIEERCISAFGAVASPDPAYCVPGTYNIPFTAAGILRDNDGKPIQGASGIVFSGSDSNFILELSNPDGTFPAYPAYATPGGAVCTTQVNIAAVSGTIPFTFPANLPASSSYRFRIRTIDPTPNQPPSPQISIETPFTTEGFPSSTFTLTKAFGLLTVSNNGPLCTGQTLNLSVTGGGPVSATPAPTYAWSGPGGWTSTDSMPSRSNVFTTMAGTYTVTVTQGACTATGTTVVVINPKPGTPTASDVSRCGPGTVNLTATAGANGSTVRWYDTNSSIPVLFEGSPYSPAVSSTRTYFVSTYNNQTGCESNRVQVTVTIKTTPVVSITLAGPFCVTQTTASALSATPTGGTFTGTGVSGGSFTPSVASAGTFTLTYSGTQDGCPYSATTTVTVQTPPAATFNAIGPFCASLSTPQALSGTPSGGTFSGTGVSGSNFTPSTAGAGTFTLTYSGTSGACTYSATTTVTVTAVPNAQIQAIGPFCVTQTTAATLTGTPTGGVFNGPGVSGTTFTPSAAGAGTFTLTYSGTSGACSYSTTKTVSVSPDPNAQIGPLGPFCVAQTTPVTLAGSPSGGTFSGTGVSGGTFTPSVAGIGTFTLTYSGTANACTYSTTRTVSVTANPTANFAALGPFCENLSTPQALSATPSGGTFSGTGVSGSNFTPSVAGAGTFTLTYSGGTSSCTYSVTQTVKVDTLPNTDITEIGPFCASQTNAVTLTAIPSGGTFSGPGVTNGQFTPSAAGAGTHNITYSGAVGSCNYSEVQPVVVQAVPDATIAAVGPFCVSQTTPVALTGTPSGGTFSGTGVSGGNFTPSVAGTGTFIITYSGFQGVCSYSVTRAVTVESLPTATITAVGPFCVSDTNHLALVGSPSGGTFSGTGVSGGNFTPSVAGVGTFTLTYAGGTGNCTYSTTRAVTVQDAPQATFSAIGPFCASQSNPVNLSGIPSGGTFSGTGVSGGQFTPSVAGAGTFTLTYAGTQGACNYSITRTVTVDATPAPVFDSPGTFCAAQTTPINLTATPSGGTFSGAGVSGSTFTPSVVGVGTFTLTYFGTQGACTYSTTTTAVVSSNPNASITPVGPFCVSQTTPVALTGSPSGGTFSGTGVSANQFTPSVAGTGTFTITYSGAVGACLFQTTTTITVSNDTPATITPIGPFCVSQTTAVTVIGSPNGGIFSGPGLTANQFTPSAAGAGTFTLTYSGSQGACNFSTTTTVTVNAAPTASITPAGPFCVAQTTPTALTGSPTGGTFSGVGVSGNNFTPSVAGTGTFTLTYSGTQNACAYSTTTTVTVATNPTASITPVGPFCVSQTTPTALTASPSGGTFSGTGVSGNNFTPSVAGTGTFTITYAGSQGACNFSTTIIVSVTTNPVADISPIGPFCVTQTTAVSLSASPTGGTFSGTGVSGNNFTPSVAGAGTFTLSYAGSQGACNFSATRVVEVQAAPTPSITAVGPFCATQTLPVVLTGTPSGGTFSGPGVSGNNFTPSAVGAGTYTITYSGASGACVYTATQTLTVENQPTASVTSVGPFCVTQTSPVALSGSPSGGIFSGTGVSGGNFTPSVAGVGTFTISYSGSLGNCSFSTTKTITVESVPPATFTPLGPFCASQTTPVSLSGAPSGGTFSGTGVSGNNFTPSVAGAGTFTLTYSGTPSACTYSVTTAVTVQTTPDVTIQAIGPFCATQTTPVNLSGTPAGGSFSGTGVSGGQFTPSVAGVGTFTLTYSGVSGVCTYSSTKTVTVESQPQGQINAAGPFCVTQTTATNLSGSPSGGTFSGIGISGGNFTPSVAGVGTFTITYSGSIGTCNFSTTGTITVEAVPASSIDQLGPFCVTQATGVSLGASPPGGTFSGPGVSGFSFTPSVAGAGTVTLTYSGVQSACNYSTTRAVTVQFVPQATFEAIGPFCVTQNTSVSLSATPSGGSFDGPGVTGLQFSPATAGVGTFTLTYSGVSGVCAYLVTRVVTVEAQPVGVIDPIGPLCVSQTGGTVLSGTPSGGTFSGPGVSNGQFNPSVAGTGTFTLTYSGSVGTCNFSATQTVTVEPGPTTSIDIAGPYCVSQTSGVFLSGTPVGGTFSGAGVSGTTFTPSVAGAGTHIITYSGVLGACNFATTRAVTVQALPSAAIDAVGPFCVTQTSSVTLTASPPNGTFSGPGVSGGEFTPSVAGVGTVTLSYAGVFGVCAYSTTQTVTIDTQPIPQFDAQGPFCVSQTNPILLTATPSGGTFSGTGVANGLFTPSVAGAGTFTLTYAGNVGACNYSATQAVTVQPGPDVSFQPVGPFCQTQTSSVALTATPLGGTFAGVGVSGATFTPSDAGVGTFTLTYSGVSGVCAYTTSISVQVDAQPVPSINPIAPLCVSQTTPTLLTGSPSGGAFSGTGVSANAFTPSLAGVGTFTLTYSGLAGACSYSTTATVQVDPQPIPDITALGPFCASQTTSEPLNATPLGGTFSGAGVSGDLFTPSVAGAGTPTITYAGAVGACSYSTTRAVSVTAPPTVDFTAIGPFCVTQTNPIPLNATPSGGNFAGTGVTGNQFTPSIAGSGTFTLSYSGNFIGCDYLSTQTVVVDSFPNVTFAAIPATCDNVSTPLTLTATPSGGTFSGTGVSENGFTPSVAGAGTFTLTYAGFSGACAYSTTQTVSVQAAPATGFTTLGPFCISQTTSVTLTAFPAGGAFSGDGVSGDQFTPSVAGAGTHIITYSGTFGVCNYAITTPIVVSPLPNPQIISPQIYCMSQTTPFTLEGTPTGGTFSGTGIVNNQFTPSLVGVGTYTITYAGNAGGCAYSTIKIIFINDVLTPPNVGSNGPVCEGGNLQLTAQFFANALYNWSGPGITPFNANVRNPLINDVTAGTLTFSVTMTRNGCTSNPAVLNVIVRPKPTVTPNVSEVAACEGQPVAISLTLTGKGPWTVRYLENGTMKTAVLGNSSSPNPFYGGMTVYPSGTVTTYTIYDVKDGYGCNNFGGGDVVVTKYKKPDAQIIGLPVICAGQTAALTVSVTNQTPDDEWILTYNPGDGSAQTATGWGNKTFNIIVGPFSQTTTVQLTNIYSVKATNCVRDLWGAGTYTTVTVKNAPAVELLGAAQQTPCALPASLKFKLTGTGPWQVQYTTNGAPQTLTLGNGATPSPATFTVGVSPTTTTTYTLTGVTDGNGCSALATGSATVNVGQAPTATYLNTNQTICAGTTYRVKMALTGTGPWTVNYSANGVAQPAMVIGSTTSPNPYNYSYLINLTQNTTFIINSVTDGTGCSGGGGSNFTISLTPSPTITLQSLDQTICAGQSANFQMSLTGTGPWTIQYFENATPKTVTFGNSATPTPAQLNLSLTPSFNTKYTVYGVTDATGCSKTTNQAILVTVKPLPTAQFLTAQGAACGSDEAQVRLTGAGPWTISYTKNGVVQTSLTAGALDSASPFIFPLPVSGTNAIYTITNVSTGSCSNTSASTFTTGAGIMPRITLATNNSSICAGQTATASVALRGTAPWTVQYLANGVVQTALVGTPMTTSPATLIFAVQPTQTTTYTLEGVTGADGCTTDGSGTWIVTVNDLPNALIAGGQTVCSGANAAFTVAVTQTTSAWKLTYKDASGAFQTLTGTGAQTLSLPLTNLTQDVVYQLVAIENANAPECKRDLNQSATIIVAQPPTFTAVPTGQSCTAEGSILVTASGGKTPYLYSIDGINYQSSSVFQNLSPNTYNIWVKDANGCITQSATTLTVASLPAPTITSITNITTNAALVQWTSVFGARYYVRYRKLPDGAFTQTPLVTGTSRQLTPLASNTEYEVQVQAVCASGAKSDWGTPDTFATYPVCQAPTGVTASAVANQPTQLAVSWNAVTFAQCYEVRYRMTGATAWTGPVLVSGGLTTTTLTGLTGATAYQVQVRALCTVCGAANPSPYSPTVGGTTGANPCPASVTLNGPTAACGSATLSVSLPANTPTPILYVWKKDGQTISGANAAAYTATQSGAYVVTITAGGCPAVTSNTINLTVYDNNLQLVVTATDASCSTCADANLQASAIISSVSIPQFEYQINGPTFRDWQTSNTFNAILPGTYTVTVREKISGCTQTKSITVNVGSKLTAPVITSITNILTNRATINWANVPNAASYCLAYRVVGAPTWTTICGLTSLTRQITGLQNGTTYEVRLQAVDSGGATSLWSTTHTFTTAVPNAACKTPGGIYVVPESPTTAKVYFNIVSAAQCYTLEYRMGGPWTSLTVTASPYTLTGLTAGGAYQVRLTANCNACPGSGTGLSTASPAIDFTLPAARAENETAAPPAPEPLVLYPNPTTGTLTLRLYRETAGVPALELFDISGKRLRAETLRAAPGANEHTLDLTDMPPGVYLLRLVEEDGRAATHKVVKQ